MSTRYLEIVLTVIAVELLVLIVNGAAPAASAQSEPAPVVVTGVRLDGTDDALPVSVAGTVTIEAAAPLKVEADRPLPVESVKYVPGDRPGL
jgi:hypothetical protein